MYLKKDNLRRDARLHVLLIITLGIYPYVKGGAEMHTFYLARELIKKGLHVTVLTGNPKEEKNVRFASREAKTWFLKIVRFPILGSLFSIISSLPFLRKNGKKIDVIHAHTASTSMITGFFLSQLLGLPLVVTCHGLEITFCRSRVVKSIRAYILKRAFHVTCVSADLANILMSKWGVAQNKISVIPNGYDDELIQRLRHKKVDIGSKALVFVGSLRPVKDPLTLLRGMRIVMRERDDVDLYVVGDGILRPQLERFCIRNNLHNIFFFGELPHERALELVSSSDILLSTSKEEGLPTVIVEAMALGKCVIATAVGGVPEILKDGKNGVLVPTSAPDKIAQAVIELLNDSEMRRGLSKAAVKDIEGFSWDKIASEYLKIYEKATESSQGVLRHQ